LVTNGNNRLVVHTAKLDKLSAVFEDTVKFGMTKVGFTEPVGAGVTVTVIADVAAVAKPALAVTNPLTVALSPRTVLSVAVTS
jgi:acyl dehydratase